ncbi:MAG: RNA methyltransferase [Candidatus Binatia bacterium]
MADLYVALIHYPVYDKHRHVVTTAVTNIDVHDIARSCRTYGIKNLYVVTPVDALRGLVRKIIRHWSEGVGSHYNPNRKEALELVRLERTLEGVEIDIEEESGSTPVVVVTSARDLPNSLDFAELAAELAATDHPYLLLLGTGWGLADEVVERAAKRLAPIPSPAGYNHLSVRAAAAIILDRLLGTR